MIDSFKYLPRSIAHFYKMTISDKPEKDIPWTSLNKPLSDCTISLLTTGGLYHQKTDQPFDIEREKNEPTWGDPSVRIIPKEITQEQLGASHLHINTQWVLEDINRLLPIERLNALETAGEIGRVAPSHYSFMGFQGYPHNTDAWQTTYGPQVIEQLKQEQVDAVLLTPA